MIDGLDGDTQLEIRYATFRAGYELRNGSIDEVAFLDEMAECGALATLPDIDWFLILGASLECPRESPSVTV